MGETYLAQHLELERLEVLKSVLPNHMNDEYVARFKEEAKAATLVHHPNVAQLHNFFVCSEGTPVAAWEYVEGDSIRAILKRGPLQISEALRLAVQLLDGLEAIHEQMLHRDIKPENLMISAAKSQLKIIDFGLAKAFGAEPITEGPIGTRYYIAPEAWRMAPARMAKTVDVFAAGAVLYELITGHVAFDGESHEQVVFRILHDDPAWIGRLDPALPFAPTLIAIIKRAVAKAAAERYQTAAEFRMDVRAALRQLDADDIPFPPPRAESAREVKTEKHLPQLSTEAAEVLGRVEDLEAEYSYLFGHAEEIERVLQFAREPSSPIGLLMAPAGTGKSAFMAEVLRRLRADGSFLIVRHFFSERYAVTTTAADAYRSLFTQLATAAGEGMRESLSESEARGRLYEGLLNAGTDGRRVVLLIDALDEAERGFELPIRIASPTGAVAIISARGDGSTLPHELYSLRSHVTALPFEPQLRPQAVKAWLSSAIGAPVPDEVAFRVVSQTAGFPLYLRHLLDELATAVRRGDRLEDVVSRTPEGFTAYVRHYVKQFGRAATALSLPELFAALVIARRALTVQQLGRVLGRSLTDADLGTIPQPFTGWISKSSRGESRVYSMSHPLLATELKMQLGSIVGEIEQKFIDDCARWREHGDLYALRFYADHLIAANRFSALAALLHDEAYAAAQLATAGVDATLRSRFILRVLEEAARRKEMGTVAECVAAYAASSAGAEPLIRTVAAALASGSPRDIQRAAGETDATAARAIISLVALHEADRIGDERLVNDILAYFACPAEAYLKNFAARILSCVKNADPALVITAAVRNLVEASARMFLELRVVRFPSEATQLLDAIIPLVSNAPGAISKVTASAARAAAAAGDWQTAEKLILRAPNDYFKAWALRSLCAAALAAKDETRALEIVQRIRGLIPKSISAEERYGPDIRWPLAEAYRDIIVVITATDLPRARNFLRSIRPDFSRFCDNGYFARAIGAIAQAHVYAGLGSVAEKMFEQAWTYAVRLAKERLIAWEARVTLLYLSKLAIECGSLATGASLAREAVNMIEKGLASQYVGETYYRAALLLFRAGNEEEADVLVKRINNPMKRIFGLIAISEMLQLTARGHISLERATRLRNRRGRASLLTSIAGLAAIQRDTAMWRETVITLTAATAEPDKSHAFHAYEAVANFAIGLLRAHRKEDARQLIQSAAESAFARNWRVGLTWMLIPSARAAELIQPGLGRGFIVRAGKILSFSSGVAITNLRITLAGTLAAWDVDSARAMLDAIAAESEGMPVRPRIAVLAELAEAAFNCGYNQPSKSWMHLAEQLARTARPNATSQDLLGTVAVAYARSGQTEDAERVAAALPHQDNMRRASAEVAIVREGPEAALSIIEDIKSPRIRMGAFRSAAFASVERGDTDLATLLARRAAVREDQLAESVVIRVVVAAAERQMGDLLLDICPIAGRWAGAALVTLGCIARVFPETVNVVAGLLDSLGVLAVVDGQQVHADTESEPLAALPWETIEFPG